MERWGHPPASANVGNFLVEVSHLEFLEQAVEALGDDEERA
jgi:hypothetical protein